MSAIVGVHLVWPLVHHQLVQRYRIDPWRLGGWAMYATLQPRIGFRLAGVGADGARVELRHGATPALAAAADSYSTRRLSLGLFADPDGVAALAASQYPEYERFLIVVEEYGLTEANWIGAVHRARYRYHRGENGLVERTRRQSQADRAALDP